MSRRQKEQQRKHEAPISLYGMTFDQAVTKLAKAKPPKKNPPPKNPKNRKLP